MRKKIISILIVLAIFLTLHSSALAVSNPLERDNNFIGIHILFPSEIGEAASIVNASGGDWGYATIPIQYSDRDLEKWQKFMNDAKKLHIIPIIRLATSAYHNDTTVWRKPNDSDVLDFANFLDSLTWPTKNRYVILFNEVNRFDEWGGESPDPQAYSEIVSYANNVFKNRNDNFYLILSGLDNAAPDSAKYMSSLNYLRKLITFDTEAIRSIDAVSSHSYPNPNFSDSPNTYKTTGVSTYKFEGDLVSSMLGEAKPIFITETGWNSDVLSDDTIAQYLKFTLSEIWSKDDDKIVAITPFLLRAGDGQFDKFSFLQNNALTSYGNAYKNFPKKMGNPQIDEAENIKVLATVLGLKDYPRAVNSKLDENMKISGVVEFYLKSIFGI